MRTVNPRWHHLFRTTWQTPWDVSASLTWRFIGAVTQDNNSGDPTLHFSTFNKILQIRAGANNVLDKDPPIINTDIAAGGAANTYSTYDLFGRQLFLAFTAKF
jgi:iron complex outermembrane receptor protein